MSRMSSMSNLNSQSSEKQFEPSQSIEERQVFKWTDLQSLSRTMYSKASQKASNLLGTTLLGLPTSIACNGLICVGTTEGKVAVYDFNQSLLCVCECNAADTPLGPVTAVALSHDHTCVAAGHVSGYIQLYNLKQPHNPVRTVAPTTLAAVASGRKEGHIRGSKIVSIGFIAGRHTALVSADDQGLAFYHSLGKILFVEAPDILRILGRYPDLPHPEPPSISSKRLRNTILAMAPLPLGTSPHATDSYNVVALLTPTKLVVVGLKPSPRTWFKCPRSFEEGVSPNSKSKWIGALAWFPSFLQTTTSTNAEDGRNGKYTVHADMPSAPMLVYSWGNSLHLVQVSETRIKQKVRNAKTGKQNEVEIGTITYKAVMQWTAEDDILALQWLNHNQIIVVCRSSLGVYDIELARLVEKVPFDSLSLISQTAYSSSTSEDKDNNVVAHSVRTYKGRIFLLKQNRMVAGTLLTWADLILALVQRGDFLQAIDLARSYYVDEAPGNRNGLPKDPVQRKEIIGDKLKSLMDASSQYVFSEDRMTDDTHTTPDNRGVDRTALFEGLVAVCCKASIALDDFEYLFEDLYQKYDDSGISSIYLWQLEPFVLDNDIRSVPPRITQRLVALYEEGSRSEQLERIIWHMDPSCLDLNQTIRLCQQYQLYDALVYIYTRAMRDYVAPIVEFLGLIRKVQQFKKAKRDYLRRTGVILEVDSTMESTIINSYKIYPYLANVLSGLAYPSEEPLVEDEALEAKKDVYEFLFFGRSRIWPREGGKLVLTSEEDGGLEPTYPYARLLLLFDSESFLHSLDIAFEDTYLNDESQAINRLIIVRIILEIMSSGHVPQEDVTMINIFIARNVPKYPQFLFDQIAPSMLHKVLVGLAEDPDTKTREDRQLAAEYLLSVYNPHDSETIMGLFEKAGFFRILRSWHHHERKWAKLLSTYIVDPDVSSLELLGQIEEVLQTASRLNRHVIPDELVTIVADSIPRLINASISGTAHLLDKMVPQLHLAVMNLFTGSSYADHDRYEYLRTLVGISLDNEDGTTIGIKPSENLTDDLWEQFFLLQCRFSPEDVIKTLRHLPKEKLRLDKVMETCESQQVYDAVIWTTDWLGDPQGALSKGNDFQKRLTQDLLSAFKKTSDEINIDRELRSLQAIAQKSREICIEHSKTKSTADVPLEDMWFELLSSEIRTVQFVASSHPEPVDAATTDDSTTRHVVESVLGSLRHLVQTTFTDLVSITSTSAISFPRLFKRLVNAAPSASSSQYTEFRMILTGMLESYRSDEDLLHILKHLINRDLFESIASVTRERAHGWSATQGTCRYCRKPLASPLTVDTVDSSLQPIIISRTGLVFHQRCKPLVTQSSDI
ncbi:vacuolar protein sorting-associated protein [Agrocybe pediades]|nr:vacuolar protein sorting-associated protein [Agrocybe pediades]